MFDHEHLAQAEELFGNDAVMEFLDAPYDFGETVHGRMVKYAYYPHFVKALVLPFSSQYTLVGPIRDHIYQHTRSMGDYVVIVRNPAWEGGKTVAHDVHPV